MAASDIAFRQAYCWQCHATREITAILGRRVRSRQAKKRSAGEWSIAVRLDCGHDRQGAGDRMPISQDDMRKLDAYFEDAQASAELSA